jgi:uncharacterized protein (TIGR02147 family)
MVLDFRDYKAFLLQTLEQTQKRGARSELARTLQCQPGYVSRVLSGDAHFSLEQADAVNRFLGHNEEESQYFILLVEHARAGTSTLRAHFLKQIEQAQERHLNLKNRFKIQNRLSSEDQTVYFSHWHFAAIHAFLSVPAFKTKEAIAKQLYLPLKRVSEVIDYLMRVGLIELRDGKYVSGAARLHLGNDSPVIAKHHINWRLQAIQSLERDTGEDLHYSSVVSLSAADVLEIKRQIVKTIESIKGVVRDSKEETVACFSLDFFRL